MSKIVKVIYQYRTRTCADGCCSYDNSTCSVVCLDGLEYEFEEFGCVFDENHMKEKLTDLGYEISDACDFSDCSYF